MHFSLQLKASVDHSTAPTDIESEIVALAAISAVEQDKEMARKPVDIVIVLDRSGSMSGEKLKLCKETLKFLVETGLNENDFLSLVTFDSEVKVDFVGGKMDSNNKHLFKKAVQAIEANSNTNLSGGLFAGLEVLKHRGTADVSAVLLLTDGQINEGVTDKEKLVKLTNEIIKSFPEKRARPSVFTFGYGSDADSILLTNLSTATGGSFYSILSTENVPLAFSDCLGGLLSVCAQNIEVLAEVTGSGAEFIGQLGSMFAMEKLSSTLYKVQIKDMYCGEHRDLLFKIRMPKFDTTNGAKVQFTLKYTDILNEKLNSANAECVIERIKGSTLPDPKNADVEVTRHVLRIEAAKALEEAKTLAVNGDFQAGLFGMQRMKKKMAEVASGVGINAGDRMYDQLCADLSHAEEGLGSSDAFEKFGKSEMLQMQQSHQQQRSNNINAKVSSTYTNASKNGFLAQAKSRFGLD